MLLEFAKGFWTTLKHIGQKPYTVEFPEKVRPQPPHFRGKHRLRRYANGLERCVGCALCAAVCPSEAIYLEAAENTKENRVSSGERYAAIYRIHLLRCIYCGFCEEACPEDAIVMGPEFRLANDSREKLVLEKEDFLDPPDAGEGAPESIERLRSRDVGAE
jgi:NADH-quinone oxidoreductase subunit I